MLWLEFLSITDFLGLVSGADLRARLVVVASDLPYGFPGIATSSLLGGRDGGRGKATRWIDPIRLHRERWRKSVDGGHALRGGLHTSSLAWSISRTNARFEATYPCMLKCFGIETSGSIYTRSCSIAGIFCKIYCVGDLKCFLLLGRSHTKGQTNGLLTAVAEEGAPPTGTVRS